MAAPVLHRPHRLPRSLRLSRLDEVPRGVESSLVAPTLLPDSSQTASAENMPHTHAHLPQPLIIVVSICSFFGVCILLVMVVWYHHHRKLRENKGPLALVSHGSSKSCEKTSGSQRSENALAGTYPMTDIGHHSLQTDVARASRGGSSTNLKVPAHHHYQDSNSSTNSICLQGDHQIHLLMIPNQVQREAYDEDMTDPFSRGEPAIVESSKSRSVRSLSPRPSIAIAGRTTESPETMKPLPSLPPNPPDRQHKSKTLSATKVLDSASAASRPSHEDREDPFSTPTTARCESIHSRKDACPAPTEGCLTLNPTPAPTPTPPSPVPSSASSSPSCTITPARANRLPRTMAVVTTFHPTLPDELRVQEGDTVRVLQEYKDGWCFVHYVGEIDAPRGIVPLLCLVERKPVYNHRSTNSSASTVIST